MNLRMGSQAFLDVQIPILWGTRAVVQDKKGRLSVIDLGGETAVLEILADSPAPEVKFIPRTDGFVILKGDEELYVYNPREKMLEGITLGLPSCQVTPTVTTVGSNQFSGNLISGFAVGIAVTENSMAVGAPLPKGLARLVV